jgi:putative transposase
MEGGIKGDANSDSIQSIDVALAMPRRARIAPGEIVYHVLNRANARSELFHKPEDYSAFERVMISAMQRTPIRLLAYRLMPNHWHMVLLPMKDGEMTGFLRSFTITHSQCLHAHRHTTGYGHIYQGRFKSFPIEQDESLLNLLWYVERNALRATSSSGHRIGGGAVYQEGYTGMKNHCSASVAGLLMCQRTGWTG